MRDATPAGPARPDASHTPGTEAEDAITVAPEGEENGVGTQRGIRKPSAKARENGMVQDPLDAALLLGKQNGSAARGATANDMPTKTLNTILEAWTRQELRGPPPCKGAIHQLGSQMRSVSRDSR